MIKWSLVAFLALAPLLHADEASHRAAAGELIETSGTPANMRQGFLAGIQPLLAKMKADGLPEAAVTEMKDTMIAWYDEEIKWEELKPKMTELFMSEFTEPELREIMKFYATPAGQKTLTAMPSVMKRSGEIGQAYASGKQASLKVKMDQVISKYRPQK